MKTIKVLNAYAGIGGNRKLWKNVKVTAVENNKEIANIYKDFFPKDEMVLTDAHQFLLENFEDFDFIWISPPCPTHSRIRNIANVGTGQSKPVYPDMKLYEEIIFLNQVYYSNGTNFNGFWVVENVQSYYNPLIKPIKLGKHYFWSNFYLGEIKVSGGTDKASISEMQDYKGFDLSKYKLKQRKDMILRNCVHPKLGLHVFNSAFKNKNTTLTEWSGD